MGCSCDSCTIIGKEKSCALEEAEEEEGIFERYYWYFIISSAIALFLSFYFELGFELIIISQIFALISVALSAKEVIESAGRELLNKRLNANALMVIAMIGAFIIQKGQEGATAILLYSIAEKLEDITADKSRAAIAKLVELAPDTALLKINDKTEEVLATEVKVDDIIVLKPGMKAPLDGEVVSGSSYFDQSALTGESVPVLKEKGDEIFASSINSDGYIEMRVTHTSENTILAKIIENIKLAQLNKSGTEKFIEKFANYYTPIILLVALTIIIVPTIINPGLFVDWFYRGLMLLVISCPCALTLSTPLANVAALTKLSREGILVKGSKYIDEISKVRVFGFDKTGTLTEGKLRVFDNIPFELTEEENFSIIASLESQSEHLIAQAIVREAKSKNITLQTVQDFELIKGKGVRGHINSTQFEVGSVNLFKELGYEIPVDIIDDLTHLGKTPVLLGSKQKLLGILSIRDTLRISAPILTRGLKNRGYESMIISGDTQNTVDSIGECLAMDLRYGNLLPNQKLEKIKSLQQDHS
jgi:Cd2+/Zn2+-exporting ATPase